MGEIHKGFYLQGNAHLNIIAAKSKYGAISMKIDFLKFTNVIEGEIITSEGELDDVAITGGYVSDLLSDVMGNAKDGQLWITIMRHLNVIAVASLAGIPAVVFARNLRPEPAIIERAEKEEIVLVVSPLTTFEIAGLLYKELHGE